MTGFASKLGDTVLWSSIGAAVLGLLLKVVQSIQESSHRRDAKPIVTRLVK